jgi:hypothetical protein
MASLQVVLQFALDNGCQWRCKGSIAQFHKVSIRFTIFLIIQSAAYRHNMQPRGLQSWHAISNASLLVMWVGHWGWSLPKSSVILLRPSYLGSCVVSVEKGNHHLLLSSEPHEGLTICRCDYKGSTFFWVILKLWMAKMTHGQNDPWPKWPMAKMTHGQNGRCIWGRCGVPNMKSFP